MIKSKNWYSVIVSLLLIGFIMVLSIWILRLILNEMKINRAMWDYLKSYAWAESSQELALLNIKKFWYWYDGFIYNSVNDKSVLLSTNPLNKSLYHPKKDLLVSYLNDWKVNNYEWSLLPLSYDIIPLFYIDDIWEKKITDFDFSIISWDSSKLSWNIIWNNSWISWIWDISSWYEKISNSSWFSIDIKDIDDFLNYSDTNYLVLFNSWNSDNIIYRINTNSSTEFFTKPRLNIISSWEIWDYKQNLNTAVDNTEFLNILKYSIYSN